MPTAWRILKTRHAQSPFDGEGARRYGGRWTSPGQPAVYTAESPALATLEVLVHLQSAATLAHYSLVSVEFPASEVTRIPPSALPADWASSPAPPKLQQLGDRWLAEGRHAVLQVPSAVVPHSMNYLLNPRHPAFNAFTFGKVVPYNFDARLRG